uniref:Putative salivary lipocalin n=1 Tax=Ixodes ricinus TaxID=34613 RepID=A0A6B0V4S9_IXORI
MKLLPFFCSLYLATLVDAKTGEIRIDEEKQYEQYQDIKRALENEDKRSWLYYRSYSRQTDGVEHTCVYALVNGKKEGGNAYNFEQGYTIPNGKGKREVKHQLLATTYKTPNLEGREKDNAMNVTKTEGDPGGQHYLLIYSDYQKCDILRLLSAPHSSECELYLHDSAVNGGVPKPCESMYGNACGKDHSSYRRQVYNESCKGPEPPKEETTPITEETETDTTTTSTVAPGC